MKDRVNKSVDALAVGTDGSRVAFEHMLIEAFAGDRADAIPFMKVIGALENDHSLRIPGEMIDIVVPMGAVQKGVNWGDVHQATVRHLHATLPGLPRGASTTVVSGLPFALTLTIVRGPGQWAEGRVFVARAWPGSSTESRPKSAAREGPEVGRVRMRHARTTF